MHDAVTHLGVGFESGKSPAVCSDQSCSCNSCTYTSTGDFLRCSNLRANPTAFLRGKGKSSNGTMTRCKKIFKKEGKNRAYALGTQTLLLGTEPPETAAVGPIPRAAEPQLQAAAPSKGHCGGPPALAGTRAKSPSTPLPCCFPGLGLNKICVLSLPHALDCFEVKHPGAVPVVAQDLPQQWQSKPGIRALVLTHLVNLALAFVPGNTNSKGAAGSCLQGSPACSCLGWQHMRDGVSLWLRCLPAHAMWLLHTPVSVGPT